MKYFNYKLISTYRTQLMGLAILWVVFYHLTIHLSFVPVLDPIKSIGYGGVDVFLMLSGLGLYYAYQKSTKVNVITFYKRRLERIIPTYLPVVLITCLLYLYFGEMSVTEMFLNLTTLSFWLNSANRFDWYVPAILVLYLITPLFMRFFTTYNKYVTVTIAGLIGVILSLIISSTALSYLLILTVRIPIFFIGILIGYFVDKNKKFTKQHLILHIVMLILGLALLAVIQKYFTDYLWTFGLWWYPFIIITLPLCMFAAVFLQILSGLPSMKFRFLSFCGTHSLEIYLIHERVLKLATMIRQRQDINMNDLLLNIICFILTLLLAIVLKKIVTGLISRFTQQKPQANVDLPAK
ncbi:acyltransferase family protein [Paenibacillus monticola]|uniref:Acyltransferase family protein n=1 Tax=Paenibacillus monticola TaxID=2666075 RepID=A0A7X2H9Y2_9BACL|nr:acyltransferase [Paenibacillus monticola]MRN56203.1 acyltransferase family protein [Paenibacillus monticola]